MFGEMRVRKRNRVQRKRIVTSLKGATASPPWMCFKTCGTLMRERLDYEKENEGRGLEGETDFGAFAEDRFVAMYGLKKVAHDNLRDFIKGLKKASELHKRLKIFRVLTGLVPKDDMNDISVTESAATFYRVALRSIVDTVGDDHLSGLKVNGFWAHYMRQDVIKVSALYFEKTMEKFSSEVKKLQSHRTEATQEHSTSAQYEADAVRGFRAFEATLQDHVDGKLPDLPDVPDENGNRAKVFEYGDKNATRGSTKNMLQSSSRICVDCFLDRVLEYARSARPRKSQESADCARLTS